ncbi:DUF1287 domain-containing protein [Cellvibrio japonicus]|uniref:DUF1287 domain-containing protein n=1 Tax=Cellvibrio japonicus (strain Ueda107) TaxID=498211 RepID=B3PCX5_CELJU|nr:DUF1287 domain-containing protein [Cellvibrio japonicus]ACE84606.1 conserved hypothetical protein [Cellvibrio japonicus Ueda107]QEI11919.1 DUF1287 domain-containing protein [Cellvibrio japonicus]QEI15493.1 DUF1287 domain-containing protein [Cellvibrio japonicus]QEI19072.1 DUF1287 domain-containing protein [Cellvibrio japonicus]
MQKIPFTLLVFSMLFAGKLFAQTAAEKLVDAALSQTATRVSYNGAYIKIPYPMGDVPAHIGVCTDVVIRAYRAQEIDLQQLVHEDIKAHFSAYPAKRLWGQSRPDTNIDHRRVPNLQVFFTRQGKSLPISRNASTYQAGDLVTWMLPGNQPHIGVITHKRSADGERPLIVHNIGAGPQLEDILFSYTITGHYRYGW